MRYLYYWIINTSKIKKIRNKSVFLSEMAVSSAHGGGLTLQRVIGNDLLRFSKLVSIGEFGRYAGPAKTYISKSIQIDLFLDKILRRTKLLRSLKEWLRAQSVVNKIEVNLAWKKLKPVIGKRARMLVCPQSPLSVIMTARAVAELKAEYVTWIMDDHPLCASGEKMIYKKQYEHLWSTHLKTAKKIYVISKEMSEFYQNKFDVNSQVLHGAVSLKKIKDYKYTTPSKKNEVLQFGYAGSCSNWQKDGLELIVKELKKRGGILNLAAEKQPEWLKKKNVSYHGLLNQKEVTEMYMNCDAVVLPISFSKKLTAMSRLNIATKLSELCASFRPIFAVGPQDSAMIKMLTNYNAAVCLTEKTKKSVSSCFKMLKDPKKVNKTVCNALCLFKNELNLEEMNKRWAKASNYIFCEKAI